MTYIVRDWDSIYETHETRKLKRLQWIPLPTHRDSEGYAALTAGEHGPANLGAWVAILQVAGTSRQRGRLSRSDGTPLDATSLELMTRIPASHFERVLPLLCSDRIGWLICDGKANSPEISRDVGKSRENPPDEGMEGMEGIEGTHTDGCEDVNNGESQQPPEKSTPSWKTDFNIYVNEHNAEVASLLASSKWVADMERLNPGIDVALTVEKAGRFWGAESGWKHKKKSKAKDIDWRRTYENAISQPMNRVYVPKGGQPSNRPPLPNGYAYGNDGVARYNP